MGHGGYVNLFMLSMSPTYSVSVFFFCQLESINCIADFQVR